MSQPLTDAAALEDVRELEEALLGVANAIGFDASDVSGPHEVLVAVQGYVYAHNDTMEELAYARNALRDLAEKVLGLEGQVAGLRNRPAPQRHHPYAAPPAYAEPLDVPDVVYDPSWGGPTL